MIIRIKQGFWLCFKASCLVNDLMYLNVSPKMYYFSSFWKDICKILKHLLPLYLFRSVI